MADSSRTTRNYTIFGILFGALFPIFALALDAFVLRADRAPLDELIRSNPLHVIILLAPLVLGIVFLLLGREHERRLVLAEGKQASDDNFRLLVRGVTDYAIYMLDPEGHVMSWNAGAERFKGYKAEEVIGANFAQFYGEADRRAGLPAKGLATALREGRFEAEGWRYRKDGSKFWAQIVIDPIFDDGGVHVGFAKITRDRTEQKKSADRIAYLARHDSLTGLPNRIQFLVDLEAEIREAEAAGTSVAVVSIDLDGFKALNDANGYALGDNLLQILASRLSLDLQRGERVARSGSDEFVAYKSYREPGELAGFVARLESGLTTKVMLDAVEIAPAASLGVAIYPLDASDRDKLVNNADLALYRAKDSRGDVTVCFYDAAMDEAARARRVMAAELPAALADGQFFLHYQEQRAVGTERVVGYEALIRWRHPERGLISPGEFLPVAEATGSILAIGAWVIETACRDAATWTVAEKIAINISPIQLGDGELVNRVQRAIAENGLLSSRIELEVTESAIIADRQRALRALRQLKAMGVTIAIDDFGTGYSSLETLRAFPFDRIKVDRIFVAGLEQDRRSLAMLRAVLALGKSLGMSVLAEGVETREQLAVLAQEGCDEVQGFLFGRPAPLATLRSRIAATLPGTDVLPSPLQGA